MPLTARFPTQGDSLAAMAWHILRNEYLSVGNGIDSGFAITRNSATSVTVALGVAIGSLLKVPIAQAILSSIPAASAGMHRYDMVVVDLSDNTTKRLQGTEAVPSGRAGRTPLNDFLENYLPLPANLTAFTLVPLYCLRITENGLEDTSFGASPYYATHGIAGIYIGSPLNIDPVSLSLVSGMLSVNTYVTPVITITRAGGASQAIVTTPALCRIDEIFVINDIASPSGTLNLGWAGSTSILMADAIVPKDPAETTVSKGTIAGTQDILNPTNQLTAAKAIIATVGGSGNGTWRVWLKITRFV